MHVARATRHALDTLPYLDYTVINEGDEEMSEKVTIVVNGVILQVDEHVVEFVLKAWHGRGVRAYRLSDEVGTSMKGK